jgi:DNA-binding XRE family transcriptional regulator
VLDKKTIKFVRSKLNETQSQFAKRLGVSTVTVGRWEIGDRICSVTYARKIVALLGELGLDASDTEAFLPTQDSILLQALDQSGAHLTQYKFPLRKDVMVTFVLPADISKAEANRLAKFIGSLAQE